MKDIIINRKFDHYEIIVLVTAENQNEALEEASKTLAREVLRHDPNFGRGSNW